MQLKTISNNTILYVMAAEPEYGPHLKSRIIPLMTGIGPVEAAVHLAVILAQLERDKKLPDLVVSLGSAGSATLEHTGIYQVSSVSYRDMDASPLGFEKGCTPLLDLPRVVDLPVKIVGISSGSIATGASIVSGAGYDTVNADMVDMETFAILRACHKFDIPLIGLRGISDGKTELGHLEDWTQYLHVIDEKLAQSVDILEAAVSNGDIL